MPVRDRERHRTEHTGWLRAAVLGANDGILSTASLVLGVAAAHVSYLLLAQGAKWTFYRLWRPVAAAPAPTIRAQLPLIGRS